MSETSARCPACGEVGTLNNANNNVDFDDWRCTNSDCRVQLYLVDPNMDGETYE